MSTALLFIAFCAIASFMALAGVLLIWRGRRGRQTDDHPLCRACGFDLFGMPPGVTQCGECGADVSRPSAIRIGHREVRRRPLWAGIAMLCLALVIGGPLLTAAIVGVNWEAHKPFWLLHRQAVLGVASTRDLALRELQRRYVGQELESDQVAKLVETGLQWQGDRTNVWQPIWGLIIESEQSFKRLSSTQWDRYASQILLVSVRVRERVRQGTYLPFVLEESWRSSGHCVASYNFEKMTARAIAKSSNPVVSNQSSDITPSILNRTFADMPDRPSWQTQVKDRTPLTLTEGTYDFVIQTFFTLSWSNRQLEHELLQPTAIAKFEVVGIDQATITIRPSQIAQNVAKPLLGIRLVQGIDNGPLAGVLQVDIPKPALFDFAYDVFGSSVGREWPIARFATTGSIVGLRSYICEECKSRIPFEVILRPSIIAAEQSIDIYNICGDELRITNVAPYSSDD